MSGAAGSARKDALALVLGGGGAVGHAWLIGLAAGLAEAGRDVAGAAELAIGTSAGATAAAHLLGPRSPEELYAAILDEPSPPAGRAGPPPGGGHGDRLEAVFAAMREIGAAAGSAEELQRAMGAFALECDDALGPEAAVRRRAMVAARLPCTEWPECAVWITAVDAATGELVTIGRDDGVPLLDAIIASTAAPGLVPTQPIGTRRCIDGGVRSVENADLAEGFARVVVLSPLGGPREGAALQFEGLRREAAWRTDLPSQVEYLRERGSEVVVIVPDAESREAMGSDLMGFAARIPAARAGFAQGRREAERMSFP